MGLEIPVTCEPIYPGDRIRYGLTYQMQLAPMLNPVYDGLEVNFEAFFVPNRIIDRRWKEFWTGYNEFDQMTPTDIAPLTITSISVGGTTDVNSLYRGSFMPIGLGSLADFLGVQFASYLPNGFPDGSVTDGTGPTYVKWELDINALPFLAYNRIFDDWYRNERTQRARLYEYYNSLTPTNRDFDCSVFMNNDEDNYDYNGNGGSIPITMFSRNYKKDRFTTALPEPVIGGDVHIPVNDSFFDNLQSQGLSARDTSLIQNVDPVQPFGFRLNALALGTIEQLKLAFKEYSYRMKDTYNGNRYTESIESHYGIRVPDSTLQRSYYLGSSRDYVNFGEVYQTSSGDGQGTSGSLGDYAGRGAASGTHYLFDETFYEHGFLFVLMCVNPISRYFQGIKRVFTRFDRTDYFEPEFQNIGDDFITVNELYNTVSNTDTVFGYNSRWIELKTRYNELHGEFANTDPSAPMTRWNFTRTFYDAPTISPVFSEIPTINKPFVDSDRRLDNYLVDVAINMQALRPILATESF